MTPLSDVEKLSDEDESDVEMGTQNQVVKITEEKTRIKREGNGEPVTMVGIQDLLKQLEARMNVRMINALANQSALINSFIKQGRKNRSNPENLTNQDQASNNNSAISNSVDLTNCELPEYWCGVDNCIFPLNSHEDLERFSAALENDEQYTKFKVR